MTETQQHPTPPHSTAPTASRVGKKASSAGANSSRSFALCRSVPADCTTWAVETIWTTPLVETCGSGLVWRTKGGRGQTSVAEGPDGGRGARCLPSRNHRLRNPSRHRSLGRDWGGSLDDWEGLCLGEASAPSLPRLAFIDRSGFLAFDFWCFCCG